MTAPKVSEVVGTADLALISKLWIMNDQKGPNPGTKASVKDVLGQGIQQLAFFIGMSGVTANKIEVVGQIVTYDNNQTGDYSSAFALGNNHLVILVNTVTTGGDIVITGTSVSESTAVPVASDTETLTIDDTAAQKYQTTKKWLTIETIDVSDVPAINYSIQGVGYLDMGNRDFVLEGMRFECLAESALSDIALEIIKVQDDGGGKMSTVMVEDMGIDSGATDGELYDNLRTGDDDRSYSYSVKAWENGSMHVMKQLDYSTYFTNRENIFNGSNNEGIHVHLTGSPSGGIAGVDHGTLTLYYRII